jgi:beta-phosphoglucomutase-like phosphatase (HAD superfamily)
METAGPPSRRSESTCGARRVVTRDQVRYAKPEPDPFLTAADRLGVPIEISTVMGDSV